MTHNYIYLLQQREFFVQQQNIYKIGMSERCIKKRLAEYKRCHKVSVWPCDNCKEMEKIIITEFKKHFKLRRDLESTELFEGDYEHMQQIINNIINSNNIDVKLRADALKLKNTRLNNKIIRLRNNIISLQSRISTMYTLDELQREKTDLETDVIEEMKEMYNTILHQNDINDDTDTDDDINDDTHIITDNNADGSMMTYKKYLSHAKKTIIITNKKNIKGFYQKHGNFYWDDIKNMQDLEYIIKSYNKNNFLLKDILLNCYNKNAKQDILQYHEILLSIGNMPVIFDLKELKLTRWNMIMTENLIHPIDIEDRSFMLENINTDIIDKIFSDYLSNSEKITYKNFMYNLLVNETHFVEYECSDEILLYLTLEIFKKYKGHLPIYKHEHELSGGNIVDSYLYITDDILSPIEKILCVSKKINNIIIMNKVILKSKNHNFDKDRFDKIINKYLRDINLNVIGYDYHIKNNHANLFITPHYLLLHFIKWCATK